MGYTHYFGYDPNATSFTDAWPRMVADAQLIAAHVQSVLDIQLADGTGEGQPEINERRIWLNGPSVGDLGHETLLIDPAPWRVSDEHAGLGHTDWADHERRLFASRGFVSGFCKTARKPYDIAVTSILLRCCQLSPDAFVISSDGDWDSEWYYGAMRSAPDCESGPAPVNVVAALFAQAETPTHSPLVANVLDGPLSARGSPGRDPTS